MRFLKKSCQNLLSLRAKHDLLATKIALTWAGTAAPKSPWGAAFPADGMAFSE